MVSIKQYGSVNVIFYYPKSETGQETLARRVAEIHADAVTQRIKNLNCPTLQKLELWDAVIETAKRKSREQP